MEGVDDLLVCDSGHVISRDYSAEMANMAREINSAVNGVSSTITGHAQAIRKDIKEAVSWQQKQPGQSHT
jgi:hypothetical protein